MPINILFCCTGNLNRSAGAHIILNAHNKDGRYEVKSCGTGKVAPNSCKVPKKMRIALGELGYDPSSHRSQGVSEELLDWADTVVVMGNAHEKFIATHYPQHLSKVENWRVKDPHFATGYEMHRQVAREIQERVLERFA